MILIKRLVNESITYYLRTYSKRVKIYIAKTILAAQNDFNFACENIQIMPDFLHTYENIVYVQFRSVAIGEQNNALKNEDAKIVFYKNNIWMMLKKN